MRKEFISTEFGVVRIIDIRKIFVAYDLTTTNNEEGYVNFMVGALVGYHNGQTLDTKVESIKISDLRVNSPLEPQPILLRAIKQPISISMADFCKILEERLVPVIEKEQKPIIKEELDKTISLTDLI